jgi:hypothetical protein
MGFGGNLNNLGNAVFTNPRLSKAMPKLDTKRLKKSIEKERAKRTVRIGRGGWVPTGSKAFVRENFEQLLQLRIDDRTLTWAEVAAGLYEQGVTEDNGKPITAHRLTALVSAIQKENEEKIVADVARRRRRRDVADQKASEPTEDAALKPSNRLALAPELTQIPPSTVTDDRIENEIRRSNFNKHSALFKGD